MKNPYSSPNTVGAPARGYAKLLLWAMVAIIAIIGIASLVGREVGSQLAYGELGGFAVYPGYVLGLVLFPWGDAGNWIVAAAMATYYLATIATAMKWQNVGIQVLVVSYFVSLALNFFNFIYVGVLLL